MLRRSVGRSSGWSIPCARRRGRGEPRRLQPPAVASRCRLRLEAAKRRRARRLRPWAEPSLRRADLRLRSCLRWGSVLLTSTRISVSMIIWLVSIYFFDRRHVAGSGEGQLVVVPPSVAATSPSAVVKAKGATQDPWAAFCASGEILTAAAAREVAGTMSQRLREVSQQLTQQLKQVSCAGLRYLLCFGSCVCVS
jgi:hypothetical protein